VEYDGIGPNDTLADFRKVTPHCTVRDANVANPKNICEYFLYIYPVLQTVRSYTSIMPAIYIAIVVSIYSCASPYSSVEYLVQRRNNKLRKQLSERTQSSGLFLDNVRDRNNEDADKKKTRKTDWR
jgi:hypothetical protein